MFDPMAPFSHADRPMPELRPAHGLGLTPWGAVSGVPADVTPAGAAGQRRLHRLVVAAEALFDRMCAGLRARPEAVDGSVPPPLPRPALR